MAFRGYGNRGVVHLQGRVGQEAHAPGLARRGRRLESAGGGGQVTLQVGALRESCTLSPQGYYSATLSMPQRRDDDSPWQDILVIADTGHGARMARHRVLMPRAQPRLIVAFDLDGTSGATADYGGAPAVDAVVRALVPPGEEGDAWPFFLSGRGWSDYPAICRDLDRMRLPEGPVLLNPAPPPGRPVNPALCKATHLAQVLDTYPQSPAVLIGTVRSLDVAPLNETIAAHRERFAAVYALGTDRSPVAPGVTVVRDGAEAARDARSRALLGDIAARGLADRPGGG